MHKDVLIPWLLLLLIPMIPVIIFYSVFEGQNYFDLTDTAKGIVAAGPIAAYVVIVHIGWGVFTGLAKSAVPESPHLKSLLGDWVYTSESEHGHEAGGSMTIAQSQEGMVVSGTYEQDGEHAGSWESDLVHLKDRSLRFAYELRETQRTTEGICRLVFEPPSSMEGIWILAVAENPSSGRFVATKKEHEMASGS